MNEWTVTNSCSIKKLGNVSSVSNLCHHISDEIVVAVKGYRGDNGRYGNLEYAHVEDEA